MECGRQGVRSVAPTKGCDHQVNNYSICMQSPTKCCFISLMSIIVHSSKVISMKLYICNNHEDLLIHNIQLMFVTFKGQFIDSNKLLEFGIKN